VELLRVSNYTFGLATSAFVGKHCSETSNWVIVLALTQQDIHGAVCMCAVLMYYDTHTRTIQSHCVYCTGRKQLVNCGGTICGLSVRRAIAMHGLGAAHDARFYFQPVSQKNN
jgi:hypothetical protein